MTVLRTNIYFAPQRVSGDTCLAHTASQHRNVSAILSVSQISTKNYLQYIWRILSHYHAHAISSTLHTLVALHMTHFRQTNPHKHKIPITTRNLRIVSVAFASDRKSCVIRALLRASDNRHTPLARRATREPRTGVSIYTIIVISVIAEHNEWCPKSTAIHDAHIGAASRVYVTSWHTLSCAHTLRKTHFCNQMMAYRAKRREFIKALPPC